MNDIKERIKSLGVSQRYLVRVLNNKYAMHVTPSDMSDYVNEVMTTPKAQKVLDMCDTILNTLEKEKEVCQTS